MYHIANFFHLIESTIFTNKFAIGFIAVLINFSTGHLLSEFSPIVRNLLKYQLVRGFVFFCICLMASRDILSSFMITLCFYIALDIIVRKERNNTNPNSNNNTVTNNTNPNSNNNNNNNNNNDDDENRRRSMSKNKSVKEWIKFKPFYYFISS